MTPWTAPIVNQIFSSSLPEKWYGTGISIDTRTLKPGDIYVALQGAKLDGHDFVQAAAEAGASAVLVSRPVDCKTPQILVSDTLEGLRALAAFARDRCRAHVAGITGSVGKTSSKEALHFVLQDQAPTYSSPRSFNNHWGLPLAVASMPEDVNYAILEMGMNNAGEISQHTRLAKPHVAYITNIEGMHIGKLGSLQAIAHAKAEIFECLQPQGIAIINRDSHESDILIQAAQESAAQEIWSIGQSADADIRLLSCSNHQDHQIIEADIQGQNITYRLNLWGSHWAMNSLGILAVVKALGADIEKAAEKLAEFKAVAGRGQVHRSVLPDGGQITVIDESYNAGPVSMRAALDVLGKAGQEGGRRIAVLGDMLELGDLEQQEHTGLKDVLVANGVDLVFTSGERMAQLARVLPAEIRGRHIDDPIALAAEVCAQAQSGDTYMVKGSRGGYQAHGRMYAVVESLLNMNKREG